MMSADAAAHRAPKPARIYPATTAMNTVTKRCDDGHDLVTWTTDRRDPLPCWECEPEKWET